MAGQQTRISSSWYVDGDGFDAIDKAPAEVFDLAFDCTNKLDTGDTIATATFTVPTGLTKDSETNDTTSATVWLSGGDTAAQAGYLCKLTFTTANATPRTRVVYFKVYIKE